MVCCLFSSLIRACSSTSSVGGEITLDQLVCFTYSSPTEVWFVHFFGDYWVTDARSGSAVLYWRLVRHCTSTHASTVRHQTGAVPLKTEPILTHYSATSREIIKSRRSIVCTRSVVLYNCVYIVAVRGELALQGISNHSLLGRRHQNRYKDLY